MRDGLSDFLLARSEINHHGFAKQAPESDSTGQKWHSKYGVTCIIQLLLPRVSEPAM